MSKGGPLGRGLARDDRECACASAPVVRPAHADRSNPARLRAPSAKSRAGSQTDTSALPSRSVMSYRPASTRPECRRREIGSNRQRCRIPLPTRANRLEQVVSLGGDWRPGTSTMPTPASAVSPHTPARTREGHPRHPLSEREVVPRPRRSLAKRVPLARSRAREGGQPRPPPERRRKS